MRIVHICQSGTFMLGVHRYVLNLAQQQKMCGSNVTVITDCSGPFTEACLRHEIPAIVAQDLRWEIEPTGLPKAATVRSLMSQIRSFNADVVSCQSMNAIVATIVAANRIKIPCLITMHADIPRQSSVTAGFLKRYAKWKFSIICVSRINFETLRMLGFPATDLHYAPSGTKAAFPARVGDQSQSGRPNLIFVGGLSKDKGLDIAILALAELRRRRGPGCPTLNIYDADHSVGEAAYMEEMVTVLDLKDIIHFREFQEGILGRCPSSDMLVIASRRETDPLVVLEAMSRGMPIVASNVGEVAEMLPDLRYGRVIPVNSITALADAVDSLLSDLSEGRFNPDLPISRHRALYTVEKMAERIEKIYKQVLRNSSGENVGVGALDPADESGEA